jgi:hypothetical protein
LIQLELNAYYFESLGSKIFTNRSTTKWLKINKKFHHRFLNCRPSINPPLDLKHNLAFQPINMKNRFRLQLYCESTYFLLEILHRFQHLNHFSYAICIIPTCQIRWIFTPIRNWKIERTFFQLQAKKKSILHVEVFV